MVVNEIETVPHRTCSAHVRACTGSTGNSSNPRGLHRMTKSPLVSQVVPCTVWLVRQFIGRFKRVVDRLIGQGKAGSHRGRDRMDQVQV